MRFLQEVYKVTSESCVSECVCLSRLPSDIQEVYSAVLSLMSGSMFHIYSLLVFYTHLVHIWNSLSSLIYIKCISLSCKSCIYCDMMEWGFVVFLLPLCSFISIDGPRLPFFLLFCKLGTFCRQICIIYVLKRTFWTIGLSWEQHYSNFSDLNHFNYWNYWIILWCSHPVSTVKFPQKHNMVLAIIHTKVFTSHLFICRF